MGSSSKIWYHMATCQFWAYYNRPSSGHLVQFQIGSRKDDQLPPSVSLFPDLLLVGTTLTATSRAIIGRASLVGSQANSGPRHMPSTGQLLYKPNPNSRAHKGKVPLIVKSP